MIFALLQVKEKFPAINTEAPISLGAIFAFMVGIAGLLTALRSWYLFSIQVKEIKAKTEKMAEEKIIEDRKKQKELIHQVCEEYSNSPTIKIANLQLMTDIAVRAVEEKFRFASPTFVDFKADQARQKEVDGRLERLEKINLTLRADIAKDIRAIFREEHESKKT